MASKAFHVLYYKRTNKVHKSKGVSKMDGQLIVMPPPNCLVKLLMVLDDDDDNNNNNNNKPKTVLYSSRNAEVAKRVFGEENALQMDDVVVLPAYECQITALDPGRDTTTATVLQPLSSQGPMMKPRPVVTTHSRLAPLQSKYKYSLIRKPPNVQLDTITRRALPRQPQKLQPSDEESDDPKDENTPWVRKPNPQPLLAKKRALVVSSKTPATKVSSASITTPSVPSFPGAIGTINIPNSIHKVLRPHQVSGVAFLWNILTGASPQLQAAAQAANADPVRGCILADEPGIGKTLQSIAVLCAFHRRNKDDRFIVVCPSSLVTNWAKEFDKWIGRASSPKRVVVKKGGEECSLQLRAFLTVKPNRSEVLVISFDLFRMNAPLLQHAKQIGLLVVDEGHRLKNSAGSQTLSALTSLDCDARLLITGTPIQNRLAEFHAVASFVCPGLLGDLASFRRVYERPINAANTKSASYQVLAKGRAQSAALDDITKTFMLRRLGKDILQSMLPPRMELLLFCKPSVVQCDLYKSMTKHALSGAGQSADALMVLTNLRKLCSHPGLLEKKPSTDMSLSGKLMVLDSLLQAIRKENPNDKIVIVSNFTTALTIIQDSILKPRNLTFQRLDGTIPQADRQPLVDSFNRSTPNHCFAFLLSSKAGGCGLNLVGANRLVMFDADFNPATDQQAMARVYRPGQTKPCFVYRFFTAGTVEEVIYQRQQQKGNLATMTVDGASSQAGFTKEELKDCFTLKEGCDCETKVKVGTRWPDYDGAAGLEDQGCVDRPLLTIAQYPSSVLRFVHIVTEPPAMELEEDDSQASLHDANSDDEEEEEEFVDDGAEVVTHNDNSSEDEAEFED